MSALSGQNMIELARFMSLGPAERDVLAQHRQALEQALRPAVDRLYSDMRDHRAIAGHFADEQHMGRARRAQIDHWISLFSGVFDERYEARAKRIGAAHAKIGLDHHFYVGGYAVVMEELFGQLARGQENGAAAAAPGSMGRLFAALLKCAMFDMSVVISAYLEASEAASAAKSQFLSNMSHELRTPLNAVIGYSELALEELPAHAEAAEDVSNVLGAAHRLVGLINGLLDLARIEAGTVELSPEAFDPVEAARVAVNLVRPEIKRNRSVIELSSDDGVGSVFADADKLNRCLHILLANAARFTRDGSVSLHVARRSRREGDGVAFVIADTGVGMSGEQLTRLFEAPQANLSVEQQEGVGLGIAITRGLVRLMNGDLRAESAMGRGSVFTLWLPLASPAGCAARASG